MSTERNAEPITRRKESSETLGAGKPETLAEEKHLVFGKLGIYKIVSSRVRVRLLAALDSLSSSLILPNIH